MKHRFWPLVAALVILAAACGDDDAATTQPGTETTAAAATTVSPGDTPPETTPPDPPPGGDAARIDELLERYDQSPLRTTYRVGDDTDEQIIVFSQDPNQDPPVSATIIGDEGKIITIGETTIFCGPGGDGESECFESPVAAAGPSLSQGILGPVLAGFLFSEGVTDNPAFSVQEEPAEYAGRTGVCFTITPQTPSDMDFIVQCIDGELGFTLAIEGQEAGSDPEVVMELIEFGLPRPEDFEPTGPVTPAPGS
jgi:hypothetical protein